jgi:hypothetical protein
MTDNPITILPPDRPASPSQKRLGPNRWPRIKAAAVALILTAMIVGFLIAALVLGSILATVILIVAAVALVFATVRYGLRRIFHK